MPYDDLLDSNEDKELIALPIDRSKGFTSNIIGAFKTLVMIYSRPHVFLDRMSNSNSIFKPAVFGIFSFFPIALLIKSASSGFRKISWIDGFESIHLFESGIFSNIINFVFNLLAYICVSCFAIFIYSCLFHLLFWIWKGAEHKDKLIFTQTIRFCCFTAPLFLIVSYLPSDLIYKWFDIFIELIVMTILGWGLSSVHRIRLRNGVMAALTPIILYNLIKFLLS